MTYWIKRNAIVAFILMSTLGSSVSSEAGAQPFCASLLSCSVQIRPDQRFDYFRHANRPDAYGMTSPFSQVGQFNAEVAPDVLYIWMSEERLQETMSAAHSGLLLPDIHRPYFLWRTPMGSFGYGAVSVRVRLKKEVKFVLAPHLHPTDKDYAEKLRAVRNNFDLDNTVFVSEIPAAGYHEYWVMNGKPLHSISTATPEHLEEMIGESRWIESHNDRKDFDLIFKIAPTLDSENWVDANLVKPAIFDLRTWDRKGLVERVNRMKALVAESQGGTIVYAQGEAPNRRAHFASKLKPYWER